MYRKIQLKNSVTTLLDAKNDQLTSILVIKHLEKLE